ncbi:MAG: UDP-glucose 4-epimerase [Syntrophomonadaceae bacterium]|nr:UDP-glucose 4-epimerase [Bacillota bacterium]
MKVLVTGGSGFIGAEIASQLAESGSKVVVYDIGAWDRQINNIEYVKGDIFDAVHLREALTSCDAVIHMVGLADARVAQEHPQLSFDLNLRSLQVAFEAARNSNVFRFLLPSSASIYGPADRSPIAEDTPPKLTNIYTYHKFMAEKLAECYTNSYGMNTTVLRLFNVYGIQGKGILNILVDKATKEEVIKLYGEKQKRDFIYISDVAKAFANILDIAYNRYEVFNVGTGIGRSIEDIVNLVKEHFPSMTIEYGKYDGVLYDSVADITRLKKATGFDPDKSDRNLRKAIGKMIRNSKTGAEK